MTETSPCKTIRARAWAIILWPVIFLMTLGAFIALRCFKTVMRLRQRT